MSQNQDQLKMGAAESAAALVENDMIVGLGSGSTAAFAVSAIGRRVKEGLRIVGIPTSENTAKQARALGIPLSDLEKNASVDMTIDGADQVEEGTLNLIKGHGGALLREKIVATVSKRLVIIVDSSKVVSRLAINYAVPVEVVPFGWQVTARHLAGLGAKTDLRRNSDGGLFVSDGGNYILDCTFEPNVDAVSMARDLDHVVGVVELGFFVGMTFQVHVADSNGVRLLTKPGAAR